MSENAVNRNGLLGWTKQMTWRVSYAAGMRRGQSFGWGKRGDEWSPPVKTDSDLVWSELIISENLGKDLKC